jgi:hypothetical protein
MSGPTGSPRTTSFFDTEPPPVPPPAARHTTQAPSPLNLSRASSVRRAPSNSLDRDEPLSPLHASPTISPSSSTWKPPLPPTEDIELRLEPTEEYLLGEGRYARVYLASYKGKGKAVEGQDGGWELCAAKRMNPDRESQTMGLREAFFLNRLKCPNRGVHIIKLLAIREHTEKRSAVHGRSVSDVKDVLGRPRSSTDLSSFPSFPSLAHILHESPAISRSTLLLEHAPLGTLDHFLRASPGLVGREMWLRWARQCSEAVAWTHEKGILHADIKPANLLVSRPEALLMTS